MGKSFREEFSEKEFRRQRFEKRKRRQSEDWDSDWEPKNLVIRPEEYCTCYGRGKHRPGPRCE
jgi:hypothetical protein